MLIDFLRHVWAEKWHIPLHLRRQTKLFGLKLDWMELKRAVRLYINPSVAGLTFYNSSGSDTGIWVMDADGDPHFLLRSELVRALERGRPDKGVATEVVA